MSRVRPFIVLFFFAALTLPLMPLQQIFVWTSPRLARWFPHWYHRKVARILGIRLSFEGARPARGPILLASNHVSWLDIVVLSAAAPLSFIAKKQVNRWPFFGSLARLQRTVFIDRERRTGTDVSRDEIGERLKSGDILVLFAEGTSNDGATIKPFKSAFFAAADHPDVKVQPVTLAYVRQWGLPLTRRRRPNYAWYGDMDLAPHLWEALACGPVDVTVTFHEPKTLAEMGNRKALSGHAESLIRKTLALQISGKVE